MHKYTLMGKHYTLVFKVEIETLFDEHGKLSLPKMEHLAMTCVSLQNAGKQVIIVSSGAIALGSARLGFDKLPSGLVAKQAVAAVGQAELIKTYQGFFDSFNQMIAQVLITNDVVTNPVRNKNANATFHKLLERGIIPVVNENDSVSTDDIIENDNYPLALIVASITNADFIVIRTYREATYQLLLKNCPVLHEIQEDMLYSLDEHIQSGKFSKVRVAEDFPSSVSPLHTNFQSLQ